MKTICSNCEAENETTSKYCSVCGYQLPLLENQNVKAEIEETKATKPKRKFDLKTTIGFIIGFTIMSFVTQSLLKPTFDKQLVEFANDFNKSCPMNLDQYTTLQNIVALPNKTIQYNYILIGITKAQVEIETLKKQVFTGILRNVKTNPDMKFFRDNDVTLNYSYSDESGAFIAKYVIKPEMYK